MEQEITISKQRLDELEETEQWAFAMKAAGVNDWEGYGYAMEILDKGEIN